MHVRRLALALALCALACAEEVDAPPSGGAQTPLIPPENRNADPLTTPRAELFGEADQHVVRRFHELSAPSVFENRYLGIVTQQSPTDVWITFELLHEVKPDVIIETGTLNGGSAALWATFLAQVSPQGRVVTVDIEDNVREAKDLPIVKERVDFLVGSSTDPAIVADVTARVAGKRAFVILDSDHRMPHVLDELRAYAPLVPVGGYVVVQDSIVNGHPLSPHWGPGPYEAVEAFLAEDDRFIADRSRERMLLTLHPKGYLKRVK